MIRIGFALTRVVLDGRELVPPADADRPRDPAWEDPTVRRSWHLLHWWDALVTPAMTPRDDRRPAGADGGRRPARSARLARRACPRGERRPRVAFAFDDRRPACDDDAENHHRALRTHNQGVCR